MSNAEAVALLSAGRPEAAVTLLESRLRSNDADAQAWFLLGACRHALNDLSGATAAFARSLALDPARREAHLANITVLRASGNSRDALVAAQKALAKFLADGQVLYAAALCLEDLGQSDAALAHYDRALEADPKSEDALHNRGLLLARLGRHEDAVANQHRYIAAHPTAARAHAALVDELLALGRFEEVLNTLDVLETLTPQDASVRVRRGIALASLRRFDEARRTFADARAQDARAVAQYLDRAAPGAPIEYQLSPENIYFAAAWAALGRCEWSGWDAFVEEMRASAAREETVIEPAVAFMSRLLPLSGRERHVIARNIARRIEATAPLPPARTSGRARMRIGVLSPDFREHLNAYLLLPLFELLDRTRFEIHAFSLAPDDGSAIRGRLRSAADAFRDLGTLSDLDAARAIRTDGIDILLDVGGHTTGGRFAITVQQPAPLQVNYLGFSCSLASQRVDYAIVDRIVACDDTEWTESRVYLPDTHFLYDFRADPPAVSVGRRDYGLPEDAFAYCAFHRAEKISSDVFALWMRILAEAPGSVLWFRALTDRSVRNLQRGAAEHRIDPARLVFAPFEPSQNPRYLARHSLGDLMLDSLHHNAITSACDALGAGLPLLTLPANAMAGRAGESLVRAAGLPELVARDREDYVRIAVQLAREPAKLQALKNRLRANRHTAPLFDTAGRVRALERAFQGMYSRMMRGEPPASFDV